MGYRKREPGESMADYRQAMKSADRNIKARLQGKLIHNSTPGMNAGAYDFTPRQQKVWGWIADRLPGRLVYVCFLKVAATRALQAQPYRKAKRK